ncbi:hypothetical protein FRB99_008466, partial [Tulasnella sp. 403]
MRVLWSPLTLILSALLPVAVATIGQAPSVSFDASSSGFPVVAGGKIAPVITDPIDSPGVHRVVQDF